MYARKRLGFTLIEMLVLAGISVLVTATLLPTLPDNASRTAKRAHCATNYRHLMTALSGYMEDNDSRFPYTQSWFRLLMVVEGQMPPTQCRGPFLIDCIGPYCKDTEMWLCPELTPDSIVPGYGSGSRRYTWKQNGGAYGGPYDKTATNVMWNMYRPDASSRSGYSLIYRSTAADVTDASKALMMIELPYWSNGFTHLANKTTQAVHVTYFDGHVELVANEYNNLYWAKNTGGWDNPPAEAPANFALSVANIPIPAQALWEVCK